MKNSKPSKNEENYVALASATIETFMPHPDIIKAMSTSDPSPIKPGGGYEFTGRPLRVSYYVHIDLALNINGKGDCAGFAMAHFDGYEINKITGEKQKRVVVDIAEQIKAGVTGQIEFSNVRNRVYALKKMGYNIVLVTLDQFQSADTISIFRSKGIRAEYLSVDRTIEPYNTLKEVINSGRIKCHQADILFEELRRLEITKASKVDHPPSEGCFTGDTRVALLDGTNPTFRELKERYKPGEKFYVYSISKEGVCVGTAYNSRITNTTQELVEVTLDNYQVIRCTPKHLFMTISSEWVEAQNLTPDISIMPLYRSSSQKGGWNNYERLFCPIRHKRLLTHRLVYEDYYGKIMGEEVVHHKDQNKHNNSPGNLALLSREGHSWHHTKKRHQEDPEYVKKLREGHRIYRDNGGNEKSRQNILKLFAEGKLKRGRELCSIEGCTSFSDAKKMCGKHYQFFRRIKLKAARSSGQVNHRILSIQKLNSTEDVWDITVDKYHNFALTSGIFVHNSEK